MLKQTAVTLPAPKALPLLIGLTLLSPAVSANEALLQQFAADAAQYFGVRGTFAIRFGDMPDPYTYGYTSPRPMGNLVVVNTALDYDHPQMAQTVCHEVRHIWQLENGFDMDMSLPYQLRPHEMDARSHQVACTKAIYQDQQSSPVQPKRTLIPVVKNHPNPVAPISVLPIAAPLPTPIPILQPVHKANQWQTPNWLIGLAIVTGIAGTLLAFSKPTEQPSNAFEWLQNKVSHADYTKLYNGFVLLIGGFVITWAIMSVGLYYHINPEFLPYPLIRLLMAVFITLFALLATKAIHKFIAATTLILIGITV